MLALIMEVKMLNAIAVDQDGGVIEVYGIRSDCLEVGMIVEGDLFNDEDDTETFFLEAKAIVDEGDDRLKSIVFDKSAYIPSNDTSTGMFLGGTPR